MKPPKTSSVNAEPGLDLLPEAGKDPLLLSSNRFVRAAAAWALHLRQLGEQVETGRGGKRIPSSLRITIEQKLAEHIRDLENGATFKRLKAESEAQRSIEYKPRVNALITLCKELHNDRVRKAKRIASEARRHRALADAKAVTFELFHRLLPFAAPVTPRQQKAMDDILRMVLSRGTSPGGAAVEITMVACRNLGYSPTENLITERAIRDYGKRRPDTSFMTLLHSERVALGLPVKASGRRSK